MKYEAKKNKVYHNNKIYHQTAVNEDGSPKLMFRCSDRQIDFYIEKTNAILLRTNPDGTRDIQMTQPTKGLGCITEYDLSEKFNRCVVSAAEEDLTQHHVVPSMFVRNFPDKYKLNNSHDVVLLTIDNHAKYEREASLFKDELAKKYNAPTINQWMRGEGENQDMEAIQLEINQSTLAYALFHHSNKMPPNTVKEKVSRFIELTGEIPNEDVLKKYMKKRHKFKLTEKYGEIFVPLIGDIEEFCYLWRKHFIDTMNPQYMPTGWSLYGNRNS